MAAKQIYLDNKVFVSKGTSTTGMDKKTDMNAWVLDVINDTEGTGGTFNLADGSASAPSLFFDSDTDTGIFYGGTAGEVGVASGGTEIATFDGDGLTVSGTILGQTAVVSGDSIDTAGAVTLTAAQSGTTFLVDKADGLAFTTPDAGAGDIIGVTYKFIVTTSITSNAFSISGATTDNLMQGGVTALDFDTADVVDFFTPDADTDVFSANGGTTGGLEGTVITITCIGADNWYIEGTNVGDGVIVTPFD